MIYICMIYKRKVYSFYQGIGILDTTDDDRMLQAILGVA